MIRTKAKVAKPPPRCNVSRRPLRHSRSELVRVLGLILVGITTFAGTVSVTIHTRSPSGTVQQ